MIRKAPFDQRTISKLEKILTREPEVLAAYSFGSQALDYPSAKSDLDIGLVVKNSQKIDYRQLYSKISSQIKRKEVDLRLIEIDDFDPLFAFNVIKSDLCLYKKSEEERIQIEKKIMKVLFDNQHTREIYHHYLDKSFKEGTFGHAVKFNP